MKQTINIRWQGPYHINGISLYFKDYSPCIYAISRKWGSKENLLYIGRTSRDLRQRIKEHNWLNEAKGIFIRRGTIELKPNQKWSDKLFHDIEALLITTLKPPENTQNTQFYCGRDGLDINNCGHHGPIKKYVSTDDLPWG
ncbi:MAG: GIY-YIG nuclease family protein [Syntrophomonadaceae bacterium]|nr:GIY-YIG nuclease family protein [Syntrophomonadaceae bacterium]